MHQGGLRRGAAAVRCLEQATHQARPLPCLDARRNHLPHGFVEGDEPSGVTLAQQDERQSCGQAVPVGTLREPRRRATPSHRTAGIEQDHGSKVRLFLELLDEQPVRASEHLPIEVARLVARLVSAVLRELHRKAAERRAVDPGQKALHHPLRHDLDPTEPGHLCRVEQIDALRVSHAWRKVMGGRLSRPEDTGTLVTADHYTDNSLLGSQLQPSPTTGTLAALGSVGRHHVCNIRVT